MIYGRDRCRKGRIHINGLWEENDGKAHRDAWLRQHTLDLTIGLE